MKVWSWRQAIQKSSLSPTVKLILLNLSIYMDENGHGCFPATKRQAEDTGLSERCICTNIATAEKSGYIIRNQRGEKGRAWKRQEYAPSIPQGTEGGSVRKDDEALKEVQRDNTRGTEPDDIKALNLTTRRTEGGSVRIYSINTPYNTPYNTAEKNTDKENNNTIKKSTEQPQEFIKTIKLLDNLIVEFFGEENRRLCPAAHDAYHAKDFLAAGYTYEDCVAVFTERMAINKKNGGKPITSLSYFKNALPAFFEKKNSIIKNPMAQKKKKLIGNSTRDLPQEENYE